MLLLLPWLVLGVGLVLVLMLIGFWRRHGAIALITVGILLATALVALRAALWGPTGEPSSLQFVVVDGIALLSVALFAFCGAVVAALAWRYLETDPGIREEFHVLLMCATFGAMTLAAADHFAIVVLGLEIMAISLYALIAYPERGTRPLEAGLKYLVLSSVATTTLLFGVALLYAGTGSLGLDALGGADQLARAHPLVLTGGALVLGGIAFKLSLVPFHQWTPDVYEGAPAPVSAFLATVAKGAVLIALLRIVLASDVLSEGGPLFAVVTALALLSMILGNVLALLQRSLKRVLAYSSIAHMGYVLVALLAVGGTGGAALGVEATLVYLVAYAVTSLAAFGVLATLSPDPEGVDADGDEALTGLLWRRPLAATTLTVALLSLAGIPLTVGFMGKFHVVAAGVEQGYWPLLWVLVVGSGIGLFYYLRILQTMVRKPAPDAAALAETGLEGGWVLCTLASLTLLLGTWPAWLLSLVEASIAQ